MTVARRNLKNIKISGGKSFVISAPTGNELAANIMANNISMCTKPSEFKKCFLYNGTP